MRLPRCEALILILNLFDYLWDRNAGHIQFNHLGEFCPPVILGIGHIVLDINGGFGQAMAPGPASKDPQEKKCSKGKDWMLDELRTKSIKAKRKTSKALDIDLILRCQNESTKVVAEQKNALGRFVGTRLRNRDFDTSDKEWHAFTSPARRRWIWRNETNKIIETMYYVESVGSGQEGKEEKRLRGAH